MQTQNKLVLIVAGIILPLATAARPNGSVQLGAPAECKTWYTAKDGDTVIGISKANNITLAAFMDANPQLAGDPLLLWRGYDYCVAPGSNSVSLPGPKSWLSSRGFRFDIADMGYKPPAQGSSENTVHALSEAHPTAWDYNPTFLGATGTGGPMQPANGTGFYPVSGAGTGNNVPYGPTLGGSKAAAEPTAASTAVTNAWAYEPAAVESDDGFKNTPDDVEGMDSSMIGPSTMSDSSAAGSHLNASSQRSSEISQSASNIQFSASAEFATVSQSSPGAQTTADSHSSQYSQSSVASPSSESESDGSTLTTAIAAPTQDVDQSAAPTETADGVEKSADGLAQSFGAVPRGWMWGSYVDPSRMVWTQTSGKSYAVYQETVTSDGKTSTSTMTVWRWPNA